MRKLSCMMVFLTLLSMTVFSQEAVQGSFSSRDANPASHYRRWHSLTAVEKELYIVAFIEGAVGALQFQQQIRPHEGDEDLLQGVLTLYEKVLQTDKTTMISKIDEYMRHVELSRDGEQMLFFKALQSATGYWLMRIR